MQNREPTFGSWAKGPATTEQTRCENTEAAIKKALSSHEQLSKLDISVFPHGSYRNRTNVRQESDVDICVRLKSTFFADYPAGKRREDFGIIDGSIDFATFKGLVQKALVAHFGQTTVQRGNKAFDIHTTGHRVDADVVPTFEFRRYTGKFNADGSHHYHSGIAFNTDAGKRIINWPDQAYANGVDKHESTGKRYKKAVRILKRLRNQMDEQHNPASKGIASCLIEALVWNAPANCFGNATYSEDIRKILFYAYEITSTDEKCRSLTEVSGLKLLFTPEQPWTRQTAHAFLLAAWKHAGY